MSDSPTSFQDVLRDEFSSLAAQRAPATASGRPRETIIPDAAFTTTAAPAAAAPSPQPAAPTSAPAAFSPSRASLASTSAPAVALPHGPIGLALSGGGIRSATFSLGVLQALGKAGRLASFDYLSTVSGGGYIGSWLSAWIHRSNLAHVQSELGRSGSASPDSPMDVEPEEISWLRRYSNYLSPQLGALSTDSMTLVSIWIRNVLLNLLVIIAFLASLLLIPRLLLPAARVMLNYRGSLGSAAAWMGMLVFPLAVYSNLLRMERTEDERKVWLASTRAVILTVLLPGVVAAIMGSFWLFSMPGASVVSWLGLITGPLILLSVVLLVWIVTAWRRAGFIAIVKDACVYALASIVAISVGVGLLRAAFAIFAMVWDQHVFELNTHNLAILLTFGPPCFLVMFGAAGFVFVGMVGRLYFERSREWWSRLNALFTTTGLWWFLLMSCAFFVPAVADWIAASANNWIKTLAGLGWFGSLLAALLAPKGPAVSQQRQNTIAQLLNVAVFIVVVGFIMMISAATDYTLTALSDQQRTVVLPTAQLSQVDLKLTSSDSGATTALTMQTQESPHFAAFVHARLKDLDALFDSPSYVPIATGITVLALLIFGWRVDVNKFSLHNMYKNRLIRCYLGASNVKRSEQPFTGFDEHDDLNLTCLGADVANNKPPQRPFHLLNTALNISQGKNLAWQERKAASFVFTPHHCGFFLAKTQGDSSEYVAKQGRAAERGVALPTKTNLREDVTSFSTGYRPTSQYASNDDEERGFTLGMAMATSGAAASPNMGPSSQPALAFLLTIFNVRLGRWSPNPAGKRWQTASPHFGLLCLLQELFGKSNERSSFVYLSDGGHFDNMGIYELIRRRCSVIWLVDAAADPERTFADLGRSVRQCRIDFGVEITFPSLKHLVGKCREELPESGFTAGEIDYGMGRAKGKIIYIKPTLCRGTGEPVDVLAYAARNPSFPQQTTADQFFEESQFESYRRLGLHIGSACVQAHADDLPVVAPDTSQPLSEAVIPATPLQSRKWFAGLLLGAMLVLGLMGVTQRCMGPLPASNIAATLQPWSSQQREIAYAANTQRAGALMQLASSAASAALNSNNNIDATINWFEQLLAGLGIDAPSAPKIWLWLDNLLTLLYTSLFILGYVYFRQHLVLPIKRSTRVLFITLMLLAIATASADLAENFVLLGGLGADATTIAFMAGRAACWTAIKVNLFVLNVSLLSVLGVVVWMRRKFSGSV